MKETNSNNLSRENKNNKIIFGVLGILGICIYIFIFIFISSVIDLDNSGTTEQEVDAKEENVVTVNEEYIKIFSDRHIEDTNDLEVMAGREYEEYAVVDESDVIRKMEFCYANDTILCIVETAYFPITGFSVEEVKEFDNDIKNEIEELEKLSFVEIEHEIRRRYYVLKINYKYLDEPSHVSALSPLSKINSESWDDEDGYVSAVLTKARLQYAGYVKK